MTKYIFNLESNNTLTEKEFDKLYDELYSILAYTTGAIFAMNMSLNDEGYVVVKGTYPDDYLGFLEGEFENSQLYKDTDYSGDDFVKLFMQLTSDGWDDKYTSFDGTFEINQNGKSRYFDMDGMEFDSNGKEVIDNPVETEVEIIDNAVEIKYTKDYVVETIELKEAAALLLIALSNDNDGINENELQLTTNVIKDYFFIDFKKTNKIIKEAVKYYNNKSSHIKCADKLKDELSEKDLIDFVLCVHKFGYQKHWNDFQYKKETVVKEVVDILQVKKVDILDKEKKASYVKTPSISEFL